MADRMVVSKEVRTAVMLAVSKVGARAVGMACRKAGKMVDLRVTPLVAAKVALKVASWAGRMVSLKVELTALSRVDSSVAVMVDWSVASSAA